MCWPAWWWEPASYGLSGDQNFWPRICGEPGTGYMRAVQVCCVMAGLPGDVQGSSPWLLLTL